jgi:hypothetical protein
MGCQAVPLGRSDEYYPAKKMEIRMRPIRELIPHRFYLVDYPSLFVSIGVTLVVAFVVYATLFGSVW